MNWSFDNSKPIYIQIADKIESQILSGQLKQGDKVPSVRELAVIASVNPNTMQRAMQELESRSLVVVQRASGRTVTTDLTVIENARQQKAFDITKTFIDEMKVLGFSPSQSTKLIEEQWNN